MSQSSDPAPSSWEHDAAWTATQWHPEPEALPLPAQRPAADPVLPGWGAMGFTARPGGGAAEARYAGGPSLADGTARKPARRPTRSMTWVVLGAILVGGLIYGGIVAAGRLVAHSVEQQVGQLPAVQVATQLIAAGRAMDLYRTDTGSYPADLTQLAPYGFAPASDVAVRIVPTSGAGYCLAGGLAGRTPTAWYSGTGPVTPTPCG